MGHIRLKRLPATRQWQHVVALLVSGASVKELAAASADAADAALRDARTDPALAHSFWLLTQLPLAARSVDFAAATDGLGIDLGGQASLLDIVAAYSNSVDRSAAQRGQLTDLGEMARRAGAESLAAMIGPALTGLFAPEADDARLALGRLASPNRFAALAREFFTRLTVSHLGYYLSRAVPLHVGSGGRFEGTGDHTAFNAAMEQHCREASRIVEAFAGGWFSKANYEGGITPAKARNFVFVALGKISAELQQRRGDGA